MNTPRFVILGAQGAGKGTQAGRLARRLGIKHISTGDVLRAEIASGSRLGKQIGQIINRGRLVPSSMSNAMMKHRLSQPDCQPGWISDGYPRRVDQAQALARYGKPNLIIVLHLTDRAAIKRLSGRRVCPKGHVYHLRHDPPKKKRGYCDHDGLRLRQRDDDTPQAIRKRLHIYHHETEKVITWYKERVLVINVDAHPSISIVYRSLLKKMNHIAWLSSRLQKK
ncbi:MAG: nucleoside monophosphate kinase [Candidatus Kerfeldbacteria bacterium]|nr:nucleoside monophosphate kinase [Candidatus Kerfeldbacteria bacterium]